MNVAKGNVAVLDHASKKFGDTLALDDLTLRLERGSVTALLGPNGAGKTTAVKLLLGLCAPTSGTATLFGGDPRQATTRTRVGAMLQVGKVPETLKVREHIDLFRSYYPRPLPISEIVDAAGLDGIEDRKFGDLSGGQRQRVLFALAMSGDPDLLVLDEPTVGLDADVRRALWSKILEYVARGRSVLLTTHYLDEADALADRVVVVDHGVMIADGTPSEIKRQVAPRRIRCVTRLTQDVLATIPGVTAVRVADGTTELLVTAAEEAARALLNGDDSLRDLEITDVSLEDAFLALTNGAHRS